MAAHVLARLEEHTLANHNKNPQTSRFSEAVTLLSGLSGGAVGNMFFASAYQNGSIPQDVLDRIIETAFSSGLSQAAKGLAYSDLPADVSFHLHMSPPLAFGYLARSFLAHKIQKPKWIGK